MLKCLPSIPILLAASALIFAAPAPEAFAAAKKSSTGEACTKSGTVRRDGKDAATGEKLNCQWDYCTYCGTSGGKIDCSIMKTEYSNPTDCRSAARRPGTGILPRDLPKSIAP